MTDRPLLKETLNTYEQSLTRFEGSTSQTEELAIAVLVARDAVQKSLEAEQPLKAIDLVKLRGLDDHLKQKAHLIAAAIADVQQWRSLLKPCEIAWWWPKPTLTQWEVYSWLWNAGTTLFFTASLSLLVETSSRFLLGGIGFISAASILGQTVLTLLASKGVLTAAGQEAMRRVLERPFIPKAGRSAARMAIAIILFSGLAIFAALLPKIAFYFNHTGYEHYRSRRFESALSDYQKAIALKPNYTEVYYRLGLVYEELQGFEKAISQYQIAVRSDPEGWNDLARLKAYNNLGRLQIWQKNYRDATVSLRNGLDRLEENPEKETELFENVRYTLLKNLGWAQLEQKLYLEAGSLLKEAIALNPERGSAYCLLARTWEGREEKEKALKNWEDCLTYVDIGKPDEYLWYSMANERIAVLEEEK